MENPSTEDKLRIDGLQDGFSLQDVWVDGGIHLAANGIVRALLVGEGESNVLPNQLARWSESKPMTMYAMLAGLILTCCYNVLVLMQTIRQLRD